MLEEFARQAGLTPERTDEVDVPYEFRDRATLEPALVAIAPVYGVGPKVAGRVAARRSKRPPSESGEAMAPLASRTGSGI